MSMKLDRSCKYCETQFFDVEGRVFANHVRWCPKNTTNGDKGRLALRKALEKYVTLKQGEITIFDVTCYKCKKLFQVHKRSKKFSSFEQFHCSRKCANKRVHSLETKLKISISLSKETFTRNCEFCDKTFQTKSKTQKTCGRSCGAKNRFKNKNHFREYWWKCQFQFSLNDFPDRFDFSLIEKHGWYKAANHGNNLNGVSRDHMVSIKYGFENSVDPNVIAHPANCQLLRHNDNVSKYSKCSITLNELNERIKIW
jgi:hypothetical protein